MPTLIWNFTKRNQPEPSAAQRCARNFDLKFGPKSSPASQSSSVVNLYLININHFTARLQNYTSRIEAVTRIMTDDVISLQMLLRPNIFQPVATHDPKVEQVDRAVEVQVALDW